MAYLGLTEQCLALQMDINNGGFLLRNSEWGRDFVERWHSITVGEKFKNYPFTDNGPFTETVLRMGTAGLPENDRYKATHCLKQIHGKNNARQKGGPWLECVTGVKNRVAGPWARNKTRELGPVRFVATANGFNTHGWEEWKAKKGRTQETFFQDGMFVLHNKKFAERVSSTSISCPQAAGLPEDTLKSNYLKRVGTFAFSEFGVCNLDNSVCRRQHFGNCQKTELDFLVGKAAIDRRIRRLQNDVSGKGGKKPSPLITVLNLDKTQKLRPEATAAVRVPQPDCGWAIWRSTGANPRPPNDPRYQKCRVSCVVCGDGRDARQTTLSM